MGRPSLEKEPEVDELWLGIWLIMAEVHKYELTKMQNKKPEPKIVSKLKQIRNFSKDNDQVHKALKVIKEISKPLAALYRRQKGSYTKYGRSHKDPVAHEKYIQTLQNTLAKGGIEPTLEIVSKFALTGEEVDSFAKPLDAARVKIYSHFGLKYDPETIVDHLNNKLVSIPEVKNHLDLLKPLLKATGYSESSVQTSISWLSIDFEKIKGGAKK